ncbi:MAG TPA: hypothetical protein VLT45_00265 [Kofleriaceae bacterium]|nr:hypothetical protein [Kofleriaceae bacterium]
MRSNCLAISIFLLASACGGSHGGGPAGTGDSQTQMVSASSGGSVTVDGTTLTIPPGALPADTQITITSTTSKPPSSYSTWYSPVFKFDPDGLVFLAPVQISLEITGSPSQPTVWWSKPTGGFEAVGGTVNGHVITASVMHFSQGFVAGPPQGGTGPDAGGAPDSGVSTPDGGGGPDSGTTGPDGGTHGDGGTGGADAGGTGGADAGGTCNFDHVCQLGEGPACPDCMVMTDGGMTGGGDGGTMVDAGTSTCNFDHICQVGEDPSCPDCMVVTDGGTTGGGDGGTTVDAGTITCNFDHICQVGEGPGCPDCP